MITSKFPSLPKVPLELPEEQDVIDYLTALRRRLIDELTIVRKTLEREDTTSQVVAEEYEPDEIVQYSLPKRRLESTGYTTASFAPADHHILSATHGDTTAAAVVRGDIITGQGATPKWTRLAKGAAGTILNMGADEPQWSTQAALLGSGTNNYIPKFLVGATPTLANSIMSESGAVISVNGNINLPVTDATKGQIQFGGNRFFHIYGTDNLFLGVNAGNLTTTSNSNLGVGKEVLNHVSSGQKNSAFGIGCQKWNFTGSYNTSVGYSAHESVSGNSNDAFGTYSGYSLTSGTGNVFYGAGSGRAVTTTNYNTFVGNSAGSTGSASDLDKAIGIGYNTQVTADNACIFGGSGTDAVSVGWGGITVPSAKLHFLLADATTNAVTNTTIIDHDTSGTAATGFGSGILGRLESSTTASQDAAQIAWSWTDATHATRTSKLAFLNVTSAGSLTERMALTGTECVVNDGSNDYDFRVETDAEANMVFSDGGNNILYLGGTTNGVKIEQGGNLTLLGTATQWEDLRIEPVARTTGANAPTFEKWYDDAAGTSRGVNLYSFDDAVGGSEKEMFFSMQLPHAWASTAIDIHVHWVGAVADTTSAPRWGLEYCWADIGTAYGDTTIVYSDGSNYTGGATTDADITAHKHYISKFASITPSASQDGISSVLIGRLFRDSADAGDTYNAVGAKCGLLYIDGHYEVNSFGSNSEYVK